MTTASDISALKARCTAIETVNKTQATQISTLANRVTALEAVKPVDLIRWLVTLACPPGGHVLDCFAGSGTTGEACMLAGFDCTLIEREAQHARDIEHRIKRWSGLDAPLFADATHA